MTAIQTSVIAAFFASGGLKYGTPFAIASIPVRAAAAGGEGAQEQEERQRVRPRLDRVLRRYGAQVVAEHQTRTKPTTSMPPKVKMKK